MRTKVKKKKISHVFIFLDKHWSFIHTAEKKRRIETAQSQLNSIPFEFANRRNHESCEKIHLITVLRPSIVEIQRKSLICIFVKEIIFLTNYKSSSIRCIILTGASQRVISFSLPKHMPQSPWRIVSMITQPMSPLHSTPNTRIMKINTRAVCPHITTNCVTTWEKRISPGDTPATQLRSSRPSILSIISAEDVSATARKKTMLCQQRSSLWKVTYFKKIS